MSWETKYVNKPDKSNHKNKFQKRIRQVQEVLWDFTVGCDKRSGLKLLILEALVCRELLVCFLLSLLLHH